MIWLGLRMISVLKVTAGVKTLCILFRDNRDDLRALLYVTLERYFKDFGREARVRQ